MDALLFPHLFPEGEGGYPESTGMKFSEYARRRLLGQDGRFERDPAYVMWLLEEHMKKRLSGNVNVRMKGQELPQFGSRFEGFNRKVFSAMRDLRALCRTSTPRRASPSACTSSWGSPNSF